jgi:hypothetical protein
VPRIADWRAKPRPGVHPALLTCRDISEACPPSFVIFLHPILLDYFTNILPPLKLQNLALLATQISTFSPHKNLSFSFPAIKLHE